MPPSPSALPSPFSSGLYLVPYWVRGGRLWGVIALVLVLGGLVLPMLLSSVGARPVLVVSAVGWPPPYASLRTPPLT